MKVLMINGSPHTNGNTCVALKEMEKVFAAEGIEVETVQVGNKNIRGCISCYSCKSKGKCVFDDMVNEIAPKLEACDGLVVASPVYYASANGTLISLLDRLFYAGNCFAYKPACVVVSARRGGTTATYDQLNKYIGISGMLQVPSCYWNMVHGSCKEEVVQDKEGMRNMRVLGRNMAWMLRTLEAAKDRVSLPEQEPMVRTNFIR